MTGTGSGQPGRGATRDAIPVRATIGRIAIVLALGLVFRLIIAYLLPGSGFRQDLEAFRFWAGNLAAEGPYGFYDRPFFHDYTPGYLYALWLVGLVGQALGGIGDLVKLPAILSDIALAWVVQRMLLDLGAGGRRATIGAVIVLANPITWFDSVVWGQVDSVGIVFLLLATRELWRGRPERSAILAVVAALIKPQLGILVPIVAAVTIRRAIWPSGAWGDDAPPAPSGTRWERETRGWVRIVTTGLAGFLTAVALSAPFGLSVVQLTSAFPFVDSGLVRQLVSTAAGYPYLSVNAYNLWALLDVGGRSLASSGGWIPDAPLPDGGDYGSILGVPAVIIGTAALLAAIGAVSVLVARRPDRLTILVGLAVLALAFFAVPTRVHERYLFPLFGLAAILAAISWRWAIGYVLASAATFANMYVVLTTLYPDNPSIDDWLGIGPTLRSFEGVAAVAILHTGVFLWALAQLRAGARATLADEAMEAALAPEPEPEPEPEPGPGRPTSPWAGPPRPGPAAQPAERLSDAAGTAPFEASVRSSPAASMAAPGPAEATDAGGDHPGAHPARAIVPAWRERPGLGVLGPIEWLRARIAETPIRPDRSRSLRAEGRGRLDRLDVWLLVVLVIASLGLRTFRLAEPARMHFDEVYHARTAAEFLQGWRYGMSHGIYEWTHPHLAKYAMAGGIVLFAGHDVSETSELGIPVRGAAIEPRRSDRVDPGARAGDRLWIATGSELIGYDLRLRDVAARWSLPGASAVAFDAAGTRLLVGTDSGGLLDLDLASLDGLRGTDPVALPIAPLDVTSVAAPVLALAAFDDGQTAAALLPDDTVAVVDLSTGAVSGRAVIPGAADLVAAGRGDALVAVPGEVEDPVGVAAELEVILGGAAGDYQRLLEDASRSEAILASSLDDDAKATLDTAIADGRLTGLRVDQVPWMAVAGAGGLEFLSPSADTAATVAMDGGATGMDLVSGIDDGTQLWVTTHDGGTGAPRVAIVAVTGDRASGGPKPGGSIELPGDGTRVVFDAASGMVEVLGTTPDGAGTTVYVIEPHGRSVFADHRLPFLPAAWVLDTNPQYPTADRGELLVFSADGTAASLNVGDYPFAWRLPGVVAGALTAGLLFLLTRLLFARRSIAVFAGLFALLDGMLFVQSRIAMNDVYVGLFILAAYVLFARLWLVPDRPRWAFWALMPAVGLLLGLALASKWVAAYAIGALGILVLSRSALGRILVILGLIGLTTALGWMALAVPPDGGLGNLTFAVLMIALTLAAVVITVLRPIAWTDAEVRLAIGGPAAVGVVIVLASIALGSPSTSVALGPAAVTPLHAGLALVLLGLLAAAGFALAGRLGFGPYAAPPPPEDPLAALEPPSPAPVGWLRLGAGLGAPAAWALVSLMVVPLVVYVVSYIPWALIENHVLLPGWPAGHDGQSLLDLTGEMYRYHNQLTAAHAASSPWWAWPLDLKPVWFYQGGFAGATSAAIYDAGNLVIWWLGVPAMAFAGWQAFRRRNLGLALVVVAFLCQWVAWARIDRASFQYHYYTSLPFVVIALGYFVAELWHGASRRTWLLARVAAAVAVLGPAILWLLRTPLCLFVRVEVANPGSQACVGTPVTPEAIALVIAVPLLLIAVQVLTARDARRFVGGVFIAAVAWFVIFYPNIAALPLPTTNLTITAAALAVVIVVLVVGGVLVRLLADLWRTGPDGRPRKPRDLVPLVVTAIVGGVALGVARMLPSDMVLLSLPGTMVNVYQGILPTYLYPFQFPVNTVERGAVSFADPLLLVLLGALVAAAVVTGYFAWVWRAAAAESPSGGAAGAGPGMPSGQTG